MRCKRWTTSCEFTQSSGGVSVSSREGLSVLAIEGRGFAARYTTHAGGPLGWLGLGLGWLCASCSNWIDACLPHTTTRQAMAMF